MEITITIDDQVATRVVDAFTVSYGYQDTIDDGEGNQIPNPQTRNAFTKAQVMKYIKEVVKGHEAKAAAEAARVAALAAADSEIVLT